jgi:uncharacterized protein
MKRCPQCNRTYSDESFSFCLDDGTLLSASYDPDGTLVLPTTVKSDPSSIAKIDEPVIAININQQYLHAQSPDDLYNCTRGMWRLNRQRAERAKYLFSVYQGVIREVYEIHRCIPATKETIEYWDKRQLSQGRHIPPTVSEGRSELIGKLAPEAIRKKYVGRRMPVRQTQNPIRYVNC